MQPEGPVRHFSGQACELAVLLRQFNWCVCVPAIQGTAFRIGGRGSSVGVPGEEVKIYDPANGRIFQSPFLVGIICCRRLGYLDVHPLGAQKHHTMRPTDSVLEVYGMGAVQVRALWNPKCIARPERPRQRNRSTVTTIRRGGGGRRGGVQAECLSMLAQSVDIRIFWEGGFDAHILRVKYERVGVC